MWKTIFVRELKVLCMQNVKYFLKKLHVHNKTFVCMGIFFVCFRRKGFLMHSQFFCVQIYIQKQIVVMCEHKYFPTNRRKCFCLRVHFSCVYTLLFI